MRYLLSHQESDRLLFRPIAETDFEAWLPFFLEVIADLYYIEHQN